MTAVGFLFPAAAYLAFLARHVVNVPILDEWLDVTLVEKTMSGHLTFSSLWAQHNQNRMLFPNILVVVMGYITRLNIPVETYFGALLLFGSIGLLILTHRRRGPAPPLLWYCPLTILMLSWVQFENTLWGFQMAWFLVLISLMAALFAMDRPMLTAPWIGLGLALAVVGSYSSIQGLIIWPSVFVLLLYRRRSLRLLITWITGAVVTTVVYFVSIDTSQFSNFRIDPLRHPLFELKLFLFSLGNVAGKPIPIKSFTVPPHDHPVLGTANPWLIAFGAAVAVLSVLAVVKTGIRSAKRSAAPIGVALIVFAFIFDAFTAIGRGLVGYASVSPSHYTTYNLLALVGCYLVVITRHVEGAEGSLRTADASSRRAYPVNVQVTRVLGPAVVACLLVAVIFGYSNGLRGAQTFHGQSEQAQREIESYEAHRIAQLPPVLLGATPERVRLGEEDDLSPFGKP